MSRINLVTKSTVPPGPYDEALVCIPVAAIPLVFTALRIQRAKYWYQSIADWERGISLLSQFQAGILMSCGEDIVNAIDRQSIMLRAYLAGIETTTTGTGDDSDPFIYDPPLTQEAYPFDFSQPSLAAAAQDTQKLVLNLVDGTSTSLTAETRNIRDQLEAIRLAVSEQELDTEDVEALLQAILLLL